MPTTPSGSSQRRRQRPRQSSLLLAATMALFFLPTCCRGFLVLPRRAAATAAAAVSAASGARLLPPQRLHQQLPVALAGLRSGSVSSSRSSAALYSTSSPGGGSGGGAADVGAAAAAAAAPTAAGETTGPKAAGAPKQKQQQQPKPKPKPARPPRGTNLLIVGLGNPGKEYAHTRHNAGFLVVDELARRLGADLKLRSAFQGEYGSATYKGKSVGLLKPTTYMNNSGQSVRKVLDYFKLPFSAVLVIVDEVALELGQIRLRQTGSPGGHNGLKSIEGHLKTKDYHRLRVGVGGAAPGKMVDHVLGEFSRSEKKLLEEVLYDSCEAAEDWIEEDDTDKVMNRVNAPR